jgi:electron transport complex protein RnfC
MDTLILNGAECEPYLTSDNRLMIEKAHEILLGTDLIVKATGLKKVYIAIEDNKPNAINIFKEAVHNTHYSIRILPAYYPQGGEKQLIQSILKREIPKGKLPFDIGILVHNVATAFAVYEAVYFGKPLYERVVTMTGDCLEKPRNLLARIGTTIKDLIEDCGCLIKEPKKIIFGGPMMGIAQYSLDTPIIKTTNGVILLSHGEPLDLEDPVCIRCARCVENCPVGIMPCIISQASKNEKWDMAKDYGCFDCIECGICNYVCPQKIYLVQSIRHAKTMIKK